MKRIFRRIFTTFFIAVAAILCFSAFGCSDGGKKESAENYSLENICCRVDGTEEVYIDIDDMSANDHELYDAVIALYGRTVRISSGKIRFVDGTSFTALGEMNYTLDGDKMTISNDAISTVFNDIRLNGGVFSFGISAGGVTYSFEYYTPKAKEKTVTVIFVSCDQAIDAQTVNIGEKIGRPTDPERDGYKFIGWYTNDKIWNFDRRLTADTVLQAEWTRAYRLTLNAAGGACNIGSVAVTKGEKVGALPTPTFKNLEFAGWYDNTLDGNEWNADTVFNGSSDNTLYAHWRTTLTFDTDGLDTFDGSSTTKTISMQYGKSLGKLISVSDSSYGGEFMGWYTERAAGGQKVSDNATFLFDGPTTLYAAWQMTVYFDAQGGTVSKASKTFIYGKPIGELPTPEKAGNTFGGWFTDRAGSGKECNAAKIFEKDELAFWSELKIYAKWSFKVKFDYCGATSGNEVADVSVVYKSNIDYKFYNAAPKPNKDGYTFKGWFTEENGNGYELTYSKGLFRITEYGGQESVTTWNYDGEVTLYAYWV